jgi:hypothetical protein
MSQKSRSKSFFKMSSEEREREVTQYDKGVPFEETRAMNRAERARWERARAPRNAASKGDNDVAVVIRIDPRLLAKAHAAARRDGKSLSTLISELLSRSQRKAS